MKPVSEETLAHCLDLLAEGDTIEQILERYPEQQAALRPFLKTAVQLSTLATHPTVAAKERSSQAMLRTAAGMRSAGRPRPSIAFIVRRLLTPVASFALLLFLVGGLALIVSASSLPGDGLYGAKRLVETIRLSPLASPETRASLLESFNEERIREVKALLRAGRDAEVEYEGTIGEVAAGYLMVASIRVEIGDETKIDGSPQVGALAQVRGRTRSGTLTATTIVVLAEPVLDADDQSERDPENAPVATMTPEPTATTPALPGATGETSVPSQPPTETPIPLATPEAGLDSTPEPIPTTPITTPGDDDNENDAGGNENEAEANDNGDDDDLNGNDDSDLNDNDDDNANDDESDDEEDEPDNDNDEEEEEDDEDDEDENDSSGSGNGNDNESP
jgi:hypothetical protein